MVTAVFLTVAGVVLGLGIAGAVFAGLYAHRHLGDSVSRSTAYAVAVAFSGIFLASVLAFFGHVLDLLTEIAETGFPVGYGNSASAPPRPPRSRQW